MTWLITVGGIAVFLAVFGICFFILAEVLPLFRGARLEEQGAAALGSKGKTVLLGVDEPGLMPFVYETGGKEVRFASVGGQVKSLPLPLPEGASVTASALDAKRNRLILGLNDGRVGSVLVKFEAAKKGGVEPELEAEAFQAVGQAGAAVMAVGYGDGGASKLLAALQQLPDGQHLNAVLIKEKRSLMGKPKPAVAGTFDLSAELSGKVTQILASSVGDSLLAITERGEVCYFVLDGGKLELRQRFMPFSDLPDAAISRLDYVSGSVSVVASSPSGQHRVFSLYNQKKAGAGEQRLFGETKRFPKLPGGAGFFTASQRNKTIITGTGHTVSVRYTTTSSVRWEKTLPFETRAGVLNGKANSLFLLDADGMAHRFSFEDPHPEAGWNAFFGKLWYEGASEPAFVWQSTGGSDDFEPKLSLTPLIVGSLKGTFFALLFAVPLALLAAVYSGCFLPARIKQVVKPVMELMSSLPSVVLGFLAGIWLAPILDDRVPSVLLIFVLLPCLAFLCGWLWNRLPVSVRSRVPDGSEYWLLVVPVTLAVLAGWYLGPWVESWAFVVKDPGSGHAVADFRLWWPKMTGLGFDQRNSLVVGFMMGFAVIPVIFTIADDALTNVPPSLKAASMALGATRWQVVRTVVLPVASAGLFSAVMIGFGRAVGETMIVVMATGNTPVMDFFNPFTGMRTLSANIAVELPEAAVHSTHFRTLFLGAMILFGLTFVLNTAAELMRQRLKERYKIV